MRAWSLIPLLALIFVGCRSGTMYAPHPPPADFLSANYLDVEIKDARGQRMIEPLYIPAWTLPGMTQTVPLPITHSSRTAIENAISRRAKAGSLPLVIDVSVIEGLANWYATPISEVERVRVRVRVTVRDEHSQVITEGEAKAEGERASMDADVFRLIAMFDAALVHAVESFFDDQRAREINLELAKRTQVAASP